MAGKGDTYRPVDRAKWDEGWNRIFGRRRMVSRENRGQAAKRRKPARMKHVGA